MTKRLMDSKLKIQVALNCTDTIVFRVCDTGQAVSAELEKLLFHAPVSSHSGLGIGLYQAARHAEANGYVLSLESNRDGKVCFSLSGAAMARLAA
jgi:sensor histidine kinase regulating citrate/malate metabolism